MIVKDTTNKLRIVVSSLVLLIALTIISSFFVAGFTTSGTVDILLNDQKYGRRALWKAQLHGDSLIPILRSHIQAISKISDYNSWVFTKYLESVKGDSLKDFAQELIEDKNLRTKLFAIVLYTNLDKKTLKTEHHDLLKHVVCRTHPELDKNLLYSQGDLALAAHVMATVQVGDKQCLSDLIENNMLSPSTRREVTRALDSITE